MVFVVQHTQERDQKVSHRKLDELLRALQDTDPRALRLEEASDDEIDALAEKHTRARRQHSDRAVHR
jgi:low affinity Fe/Cu permease